MGEVIDFSKAREKKLSTAHKAAIALILYLLAEIIVASGAAGS